MAGNNIYVKGSYIDVHDNQNVYLSVDKAEVHTQASGTNQTAELDKHQQDMISKLKPIFFGSEEEAKAFLLSIQGMKPTQITDRVNQLVHQNKLSKLSSHRDLWKVLHDGGIYDRSESNWNMQVD